tara:strand:+ start:500 stop:634 length:135 start_codon:yes stop_codon:yes gene_type:complete
MAKKLMPGKTNNSRGKKYSHGNSHVSSEDVRWDKVKQKWVINDK